MSLELSSQDLTDFLSLESLVKACNDSESGIELKLNLDSD